jgi:putative ABC transport system permease protein
METDYSRDLPSIYLPYQQDPETSMYVAARTSVPPTNLATAFRQSVRELDGNLPVFALRTLAEHVTMSHGDTRLFASAFSVLAGIALVLASMGLYAVILQSVSQRTRELGIRVAVGATRPQLFWLVYSKGMWQFMIGLVIGLVLSLALGRVLSAQLVGVSSIDPVTYLFVVPALTFAAALACGLPARRAALSDPAEVLRLD